MVNGGTLVEGVGAPVRAIHILVCHDKIAWLDMPLQTACGAGADNRLHAEFLHRPEVRAVVDFVRGDGVLASVSGQERHTPPAYFANSNQVAGRSVGRVDLHFLHFVQKRVEARAAENADFSQRFHLTASCFVL
jgi:hypothetical protein